MDIAQLTFNDQGLIPCIVQDVTTKDVLMMAWMNEESIKRSLADKTTWFWSRSRNKLWHKGEESGNTQELVELRYDCDEDTLLALVHPAGPACHTGEQTCFYRNFAKPDDGEIAKGGFPEMLGITFTKETKEVVEGTMPLGPSKWQPWGFVHGGCTISFLETIASRAAELNADLDVERPFGVDVIVKHKKPGKLGMMHGTAKLDHVERNKQFWAVEARDDEGDIISDGFVITKIVSLERLAQKDREREAARQARNAE